MSCVKRKLATVQQLEEISMKNGFKPGVYEKHGFYIGHWRNDMKHGKFAISIVLYINIHIIFFFFF